MSRLAKDLFFILMLVILLRSEPELLICTSLTVPNIGVSVLAKNFAMLWGGGDHIPETVGFKEISGLWVLVRP